MISNKRPELAWRIAMWGGIVLYLALSLVSLFLGQSNADEGWYLHASNLVFHNNLPYRDFAFTQMPLLPYVYGLPQIILPSSVYLGRATSLVLSFTAFFVSIMLARRNAGAKGAGVTALLFATFTYGIYYMSIVKTYALLSVLFTLTYFVLASRVSESWKYHLAVALSFLAAMTRLSATLFFIPVLLYCLAATVRRPTRFFLLIGECIILIAGASFFFVPNVEAAQWGLFSHHIAQWANIPLSLKLLQIAFLRVPAAMQPFGSYLVLIVSILLLKIHHNDAKQRIEPSKSDDPISAVIGIALALFSVSHLASGTWHNEYLVPAVISSLPIIAIMFCRTCDLQERRMSKMFLQGLLILTLVLSPLFDHFEHMSYSGGATPMEKLAKVADRVVKESGSHDRIFALDALSAAVASHRSVLPGMSMAQFSYAEMSTEKAERLKLVNGEIVLDYISSCAAKVVLLTDADWGMFIRTGYDEPIRQALQAHYDLVMTEEGFQHQPNSVYVYSCRAGQK